MSIRNKSEKAKMTKFIKKNPIIYICEDCGREYKNRIPFPEGCECGNICEDFFREKEPYDIKAERDDKLLIDVKYDKDVLGQKKDRKDFKNKIAKTSAKESPLDDIKKEDIPEKPKQIPFNRFKAIKILHESKKYTGKELLKMKNKKLKEKYFKFMRQQEKEKIHV